ncbi:hypothetical protein HBH75_231330 [Parastagonospora nodorum]|nr:hypothetical protein HBH75_231330 [Parastagonospora nodorum]
MHANSIIALALGATAVSAAAVPGLEVRQAGDLYRQFPESLDCPVKNSVHVLKKDLVEAVKNGKRDGPPYEASAANLATRHCGNSNFKGIPLWTTEIPDGTESAGALFYAAASNGTFYFCGTTSGRVPSGWPSSCTENY